ncbi:RNA 2',3'-cyclic phosphodiesterase [Paenibacillus jiagnxiensis]|uniref:RNA 2',3'-cyclic phosphodiesterase n=1 Tax=Paenibacillus jiagnxiensis TaxID=3228926 RepID=UPI0033BE6583
MSKSGKESAASERLFTAIRLPQHLQEQVKVWRDGIKQHVSFRTWTDPRDYHITLQFMGDVDIKTIPSITEALKEAAAECGSFQLRLGGAGTFGRPAFPRVLWRGIEGDRDMLKLLQKTVVDHTIPLGFVPEERPYSPHITIARTYTGSEPVQPMPDNENGESDTSWAVADFMLFATRFGRKPMYEVLQTFPIPYSRP